MLGALVGDMVGSAREWKPVKTTEFELFAPGSRFTDDSVLTVATADAILNGKTYGDAYREWYRRFPDAGYGAGFSAWGRADGAGPYGSLGNGSAMRVSPVGFLFGTLEEVTSEAARSAAVTHDHPEGIRGAAALATSVFLARSGASKAEIRAHVEANFPGYDLGRAIADIRPGYGFDVTCQGSVPEALIAFLESHDFESAVRLAVSLGGDADTQACMAGAVAEAFYGGVPEEITRRTLALLHPSMLVVVEKFGKSVK